MRKRTVLSFILFLSFSISWPVPPLPAASDEGFTRALWVTRWDFRDATDIKRIMKNAANARFNTILFQVRGDATVYYRSLLEPVAQELNGTSADWDPLQCAIEQAHDQGLQLHAWINVYPGWMGDKPPRHKSQLFFTHPDWFMVDQFGQRQALNKHYLWLSPTHPQVTPYLLQVCREIYQRYKVDGLHLDYVRYPAPSYSYDSASLLAYRTETGGEPEHDDDAWRLWRRSAISKFIAALYEDMRLHRPEMVLSAAVMGDYARGERLYLQDSHDWLARGIIDAIYPMIYTKDDTLFSRQLAEHRLNDHNRHVYPGIYGASSLLLRSQLRTAMAQGCNGVAFFSYSLLFPNHTGKNDFLAVLREVWQTPSLVADHVWKDYIGDSQGPIVEQVYTLPVEVYANSKFKIAAKITDPSGVYDTNDRADSMGIHLFHDRTWPPRRGVRVSMNRLKNYKDWYITDQAIEVQAPGLDFRFRIYAWDNHQESLGHYKRNKGYSDVWSLSILARAQSFISSGTFGPPFWEPTAIASDSRSQIWVGAAHSDRLTILDPRGKATPFSPIRKGLAPDGTMRELGTVSALALAAPDIMCVLTMTEPGIIYRFRTDNGLSLPALAIHFEASALDCDAKGNLFVLEDHTAHFHILNPGGEPLDGSPFGTWHGSNDIAVLKNSSRVFIADQTSGGVQCWNGAIEGNRAHYWRENDLAAVDVGTGRVSRDQADFIYVPHSDRGVITIFNRSGGLLAHLKGGKPSLNYPNALTISPGGDSLFVIETEIYGPGRIALWLRKAPLNHIKNDQGIR